MGCQSVLVRGEAAAASQVEDGDDRTMEIDHTESHRGRLWERRHRNHGQHTLHHRKRQSVLLLGEEEDDQVDNGRRQVSRHRAMLYYSRENEHAYFPQPKQPVHAATHYYKYDSKPIDFIVRITV